MVCFRQLRAQAWLGSWLGTLPAVRALAGAGLASCEAFTTGSATWAAALREAAAQVREDGPVSPGARPACPPASRSKSGPAGCRGEIPNCFSRVFENDVKSLGP